MKQKLIYQLLHKAGARFGGDGINYDGFVPSKFAELIVQEMCQVINDDCQLQMRQRIITNLGGLNQARELIKQHFGVEE